MPNDTNPMALNYNDNGILNIQLPQGSKLNEFKLSLFVQVIDDADAITVFEIPGYLTVEPKEGITEGFAVELLNDQADSGFVKDLLSGDLQLAAKNIICYTSILNGQDDSSNSSLNGIDLSPSDVKLSIKEKFVNVAVELKVTDISSIKVLGSVLSVLTESTNEVNTDSVVMNFFILSLKKKLFVFIYLF